MHMGPLSNWDLLGSGNEQNVDASGSSSEQKDCTAASFLSLGNLNGSQNTWGSGGLVSGFTTLAGTPLGNVSKTAVFCMRKRESRKIISAMFHFHELVAFF